MRIICWHNILMKYETLVLSKTKKDVAAVVICASRVHNYIGQIIGLEKSLLKKHMLISMYYCSKHVR